jgi:purine-cytosine permease-like protein
VSDETSSSAGGEFEREPVPRGSLLGFKSFIGMYAGEHCAGTELMIGPLFVAAGVSAFDVIVGLIVGNALAVLSWMFLCAPIATRARLTLYYQLEKICGRNLVTLYNLANGIMFCFLAGAMITVSATAVGVWTKGSPLEFPMPALDDFYPNSVGWVLSVLGVGAVISIVAAYGYRTVAHVANIAAPWMVLIFLAFGLVALRNFVTSTGAEIDSAPALWQLADEVIWRGGEPLPGQVKFTFWHVTFFAWFCNMAMHVGMSDLTVFRFARKSWYGVASAAGMYVGHFMAWICASMLFAYELHQARPDAYVTALLVNHGQQAHTAEDLQDAPFTPELIREAMQVERQLEDAGKLEDFKQLLVDVGVIESTEVAVSVPAPLPGPLAYGAVGIVGLLCVIVAGWTTANPTIYRAGLAFQAVMPNRSRFAVTLMTGALATLAALFPALAMKLLGFVALYGLVLMPMGAVVFIDFWLIRRFGLRADYAESRGIAFNPAAGIAWLATLAICLGLVFSNIEINGVKPFQIYFVSLPGWFVAAALYILVSAVYQNRIHHTWPFRRLCQLASWLSLAAVVVPGGAFLAGAVALEDVRQIMLVGTVVWFIATPMWMGLKREG